MHSRSIAVVAFVFVSAVAFVACSAEEGGSGSGSGKDAGTDAGTATEDAGTGTGTGDAGTDAGTATEDAGTGTGDSGIDAGTGTEDAGTFTLTSAAFVAEGAIPATYTCTGAGDSPALAWSGAPPGTQSYAVVMRDLSLAGGNNYHWVIYDIPAAITSLAAGVSGVAAPATPAGAKQTYWSFGATYGYGGPCPPPGAPHTYQFEVLAFSTATAAVPANTTSPGAADAVLQAAKTASTTLRGTYQR